MPQVELEESECEFLVSVLLNVSGPGISMAVVQPLVVKLLSQIPRSRLNRTNAIQVKEEVARQ